MSQEQKPIQKLPPPYVPIKYLLSSVDTFFGNLLVQRLRNDKSNHAENPHRILGTVCDSVANAPTPDGVRKIIDTGKVKFFEQIILNSDVIIYDLNTCNLKEAEFVISTLKMHPFEDQKTLICISNVMTWAKTSPKESSQNQQEDEFNKILEEEPDSEKEGEEPVAQQGEQQKKTYVRFTQKDFFLRKPDPAYEKIKSIETLCMAAGKAKSNLKTYIICSGLLYGEGQRLLAPYFIQARLQEPEELVYYGQGNNRIPMIHVQDLITFVQKTIEEKPKDLPYILAIDHNSKPTQKKIIESISKGVGTSKVRSSQVKQETETTKMLTLNLRMRPTMQFEGEEEGDYEGQQENKKPQFRWLYKEGVQKSIKRLCEQFNVKRGLKQTKIFITGPPGSGKTHYAKQLAAKYNLPHIHIKDVINQVKALNDEFGEEVRAQLASLKESLGSDLEKQYEEQKQRQKKLPKEMREHIEPFNIDTFQPRLYDGISDENKSNEKEESSQKDEKKLLQKCFKWRLNQNDCLNRGYILDGYPRRYEDCVELFMEVPPADEQNNANEDEDPNSAKIVEVKRIPDKFIVLQVSDQDILKRIQNLDESLIVGTHLNEKDTKRRLKRYRKLMDSTTGEFIMEDFFKENKINIHKINGAYEASNVLESIIKPIALDENQHQKAIQQKISKQSEERNRVRQEMDKKHDIIRDIQREDYMMKKENEQNEERDILDKSSLALRKYLDVNLVPILSQGILQILEDLPEDPVDFLAEFLFRNSLKVPTPDPSTFEF